MVVHVQLSMYRCLSAGVCVVASVYKRLCHAACGICSCVQVSAVQVSVVQVSVYSVRVQVSVYRCPWNEPVHGQQTFLQLRMAHAHIEHCLSAHEHIAAPSVRPCMA